MVKFLDTESFSKEEIKELQRFFILNDYRAYCEDLRPKLLLQEKELNFILSQIETDIYHLSDCLFGSVKSFFPELYFIFLEVEEWDWR